MELLLQCERFPDEVSASSVEVGYWNGLAQDNNTWNDPAALRGVRKITGQVCAHSFYASSSPGSLGKVCGLYKALTLSAQNTISDL